MGVMRKTALGLHNWYRYAYVPYFFQFLLLSLRFCSLLLSLSSYFRSCERLHWGYMIVPKHMFPILTFTFPLIFCLLLLSFSSFFRSCERLHWGSYIIGRKSPDLVQGR